MTGETQDLGIKVGTIYNFMFPRDAGNPGP